MPQPVTLKKLKFLGFLLAFYLVGSGHHSVKALEVAEEIGKEGWYRNYDEEIHQNGVWCR